MTTVLCTLYNSLYLDKGLVLYDSLCECAKDFKLYVLCMDDKCYKVLTDLKQEYHIPVRLADFEKGDDALVEAKGNRSMGEYCWTCSSSFIRYVLNHYGEECCTYIDADMFFYNDPQILVDEMLAAGKSVMVVPHWFHEGNKDLAAKVGKYCVEFNTFLNNPASLKVLEYWRGRCLEMCRNIGDGVHWGDQKYLEELVDKFDNVHVCTNRGAGVAPWNIESYKDFRKTDNTFMYTKEKKRIPIIFYHYQGISYISKNRIKTGVKRCSSVDYEMVDNLYYSYLQNINQKKGLLDKNHGINLLITNHPSINIPLWKKVLKSIKLVRIMKNAIKKDDAGYIIHLQK